MGEEVVLAYRNVSLWNLPEGNEKRYKNSY